MVSIKNVGPNGDTRQQQRTEHRIGNIHTGYLTIIAYNQYWYHSYINAQTDHINQQALLLQNEQMDAVRSVLNQILDTVELQNN
ncbi:unnamed protein product [Adineta ricciae]|uniref:Uncharacterized protein n=1 Tax=Adineta ricciae TaxID=249248 RepID=A0A815RE25_ADIRI|nr:unnamed protein product [Adineta ricciae]